MKAPPPRLAALLLAACMSAGAHAGPSRLVSEDYLQCASHYASFSHLLKSRGYDKQDQLKDLEESVQFYLQIAEAIEDRPLKGRFLKAGEAEMERTRALIKAGAYLKYADDTKQACRALVRAHQDEIMRLMDKLYDKQR